GEATKAEDVTVKYALDRALSVKGGRAAIQRASIEDSVGTPVELGGRSSSSIVDLTIARSALSSPDAKSDSGISMRSEAALRLRRFRIFGQSGAALSISGGTIDAGDGEIHDNAIGVSVAQPPNMRFDISSVMRGILYSNDVTLFDLH